MPATTASPSQQLSNGRIAALWYIAFGPLLAAFVQQQLTYALVTPACERHARALVHLPLVPGLAMLALAVVFARREWQRGGERSMTDVEGVPGSARLFAVLGFALSALAFVLMIAQWLPTVFLHPCQR
jgi:hypothetical protein